MICLAGLSEMGSLRLSFPTKLPKRCRVRLRHSSVTPFLCCTRIGGPTLDSPVPPSPPIWFISRPFIQCERFATSHLLLAITLLPIFQLQPFSFLFSFLIPRSLPSIYPGLVCSRRRRLEAIFRGTVRIVGFPRSSE